MLIAEYIDHEGAEHCSLFDSFESFHKATFSPLCRVWDVAEFKIKGTTYPERKGNCAALAARVHRMEKSDLTYSEIQTLRAYFQRTGRKYGNLRMFRRMGLL